MVKLKLFGLNLDLQSATVQDEFPFTALITYAGRLSDHYVGGTDTVNAGPFRVMIPAALLKDKIKELEGKNVLANDELNSHTNTIVVGKFISTWTAPKEMPDGTIALAAWASGILYRKNNPELVDEIVDKSRQGIMGFSYDLKDVDFVIQASNGGEQYMQLTNFHWRGATALLRSAAAYEETLLAANKKDSQGEKKTMDEKTLEKLLAGIATSFATALAPVTESMTKIMAGITEIKAQKTPEEPKTPVPPTVVPPANTLVQDMTAALTEVFKPVNEKLDKLVTAQTTAPNVSGERKSLTVTAEQIKFFGKYMDKPEEGKEGSSDIWQGVIDSINADANLPRERKLRMLQDARAQKVFYARQEMIQAQQAGGVN